MTKTPIIASGFIFFVGVALLSLSSLHRSSQQPPKQVYERTTPEEQVSPQMERVMYLLQKNGAAFGATHLSPGIRMSAKKITVDNLADLMEFPQEVGSSQPTIIQTYKVPGTLTAFTTLNDGGEVEVMASISDGTTDVLVNTHLIPEKVRSLLLDICTPTGASPSMCEGDNYVELRGSRVDGEIEGSLRGSDIYSLSTTSLRER